MLQLKILFRNAFHNKLRSGLTILGITVAFVTVAVLAFGFGTLYPVGTLTLTGDSTYAII